MIITLGKEILEVLQKDLVAYGYTEDTLRWGRKLEINLSNYTKAKIRNLRDLLAGCGKVKGVSQRVADVDRWLAILEGTSTTRCRRLSDFAPMLKRYLMTAPKHWIYEVRDDSDVYQPYFVSGISYTPPKRDRYDGYIPGYVTMILYWEELGKIHSSNCTFYARDVEDMSVPRALMEKGYQTETPELLAAYLENRKKYILIHDKVGKQFTAVGSAEPVTRRRASWSYRAVSIKLDRDGVPAHVVVDVLNESDEERETGTAKRPDEKFWMREGCDHEGSEDEDDSTLSPGDEDDDDPAETAISEIPLAPSLICFDLKRHIRMKIYVDQMTEYQYQADLGSKLILPDEITDLVTMLVSHRGGFKDIVGNKGGGAIILCAGPPGTGKTLTSEIYSEAMARPLYSVQCSQLGTRPDELEDELMTVFARAHRWNAILLLDEADVYVAARGRDLVQNAIVGVFLRVLEYYAGVLFLTTNRADLVDDAIASRCLARIDYQVPSPQNQERIWRTLADNAGIDLSDREIKRVVDAYPGLSGRDVKNLLKLGSMVSASNGKPLTADTIGFVKRFKPTMDVDS